MGWCGVGAVMRESIDLSEYKNDVNRLELYLCNNWGETTLVSIPPLR